MKKINYIFSKCPQFLGCHGGNDEFGCCRQSNASIGPTKHSKPPNVEANQLASTIPANNANVHAADEDSWWQKMIES
jgi:hypothetical protein